MHILAYVLTIIITLRAVRQRRPHWEMRAEWVALVAGLVVLIISVLALEMI